MDFLSKAYGQLVDLLRSMTPAARITTALLLAVVVVGLALLLGRQAGGPDDLLLGGQAFSQSELMAMESAFGKAGLNDYQIESGRIRVPRGERAAYMAAMADGGALPHDFGAFLRKALDQGGMLASAKEREERAKVALQQELALILRGMKGIERASVLYDVRTRPGLARDTVATASVTVKPIGSQPLDESRVRDIRHLVASSIAGLKPEAVAVTDQNGRTYPAVPEGQLGDTDPYRERKNAYERDLAQKIDALLAPIPGRIVQVYVELDPETHRETQTTEWLKDKSIAGAQDERSSEETREGPTPAGPPGTRSNTSNEPATVAQAKGSSLTRNANETRQVMYPGGKSTKGTTIGLTIRRATASISIPKSYFEKVWRHRTGADPSQKPDRNAIATIESEEAKKIQDITSPQLPPREAGDPVLSVTVRAFDDFPVEPAEEPTTVSLAWGWLREYWSTLGMTVLGLVSLLMVRSMVRSAPAEPVPPATLGLPLSDALAAETAARPSPAETAAAPPRPAAQRLLKRREGGPSLREELAEIIREDPDTAANILRAWISTAT
jgi:flagellar M-ring protein FliF